MTEPDERGPESTGPTIRDRRRIDPTTFQVREPQETAAPSAGEAGAAPHHTEQPATPSDSGTRSMTQDHGAQPAPDQPVEADRPVEADQPVEGDQQPESTAQVAQLQAQVAERTADLQRLQAEYVNYKRRVDRDRDLVRTVAVEGVLRELLPILDNIALAREHGELTGGFKAVAEELGKVAQRHGLESFGEPGDPFDPNIHDALMHAHADDITGPTCVQILQAGYRAGERVLRPASVAVAEPADEPAAAPQPEQDSEPTEGTASTEETSDDTTTN